MVESAGLQITGPSARTTGVRPLLRLSEMTGIPTLLPSWTEAPRAVVGVCPALAFHQRQCLFDALKRIFPVDFAPRSEGEWRGLQAAIIFGEGAGVRHRAGTPRVPAFIIETQRVDTSAPGQVVQFSEAARLDPMLRGAQMKSALTSSGLTVGGRDCV